LGTLLSYTSTWDNDGTTPAQKKANCWDTFNSNSQDVLLNLQTNKKWAVRILSSTCTWDNDGSPNLLESNCWDTYFQHLLRIMMVPTWPVAKQLLNFTLRGGNTEWHRKVNCWDTFTFNTLLVLGIMMVPCLHLKSELLGYFYFQQFTCYLMMGGLNCCTRKSKLLGYFHFQQFTWDNGAAQPASTRKKQTVGMTFTFNTSTCTWIMMERLNPEPKKVNCWDTFTFNNSTCTG
jgi:hypothetical protein